MVGTPGLVLAFWLAAPAGAGFGPPHAEFHSRLPLAQPSHGASSDTAQDPVPQEPVPPPQEQPPPKEPEIKNATVEGHVKLRDGRAAAGARIVAKGPEGFVANATADGNGRFRFSGPEGSYSLEIRAADKNRTFQAAIKGGQLTPAEFTVE